MFGIINRHSPTGQPIPIGLPYNAFPEDEAGRRAELGRRALIVRNYVRQLGLRAGVSLEKVNGMSVGLHDTFFDGAAVKARPGLNSSFSMKLSVLHFIDFVKDFNVQNLQEFNQRLDDPAWLQAFYDRIGQIIEGGVDLGPQGKERIRAYVQQLIDNPDRFFDSSRFVMLHELGHAQKGDYIVNRKEFLLCALAGLTLGMLAALPLVGIGCIVLFTTTGLVILDIALFASCCALSWLLAVKVAIKAQDILYAQFIGRSHEKGADQFAASAFSGEEGRRIRQGGIDYFQRYLMQRESSWFTQLSDPHPRDRDRIAMLQNFEVINPTTLRPVTV